MIDRSRRVIVRVIYKRYVYGDQCMLLIVWVSLLLLLLLLLLLCFYDLFSFSWSLDIRNINAFSALHYYQQV